MVPVPAAMAVTTPDSEPIVATLMLPELQVPGDPLLKVAEEPLQMTSCPAIGAGGKLIVTVAETKHPEGMV
jgi:hypothetical protein